MSQSLLNFSMRLTAHVYEPVEVRTKQVVRVSLQQQRNKWHLKGCSFEAQLVTVTHCVGYARACTCKYMYVHVCTCRLRLQLFTNDKSLAAMVMSVAMTTLDN